ncbi:hypothetical protein [Natronorubrum halophilum]|uniref:hypothetical protein n=1 Tax=Natronorubrum halophilum TaxID=1702106 RepID=UPI000EF6D448|nr:hypothetical protein [Natronorubrum halophilum]
MQLGGAEALQRGSPRLALVRHLGFAAVACIGLAFITRLALSAALGGYGSPIVVLGLLVAITAVAVLYRSSGAFLAGFRSDEQT